MKELIKKLVSLISVAGVLSILYGIYILITGRLKNIMLLEQEKYLVGGVLIITGLYFLIMVFMKNHSKTTNN